MPSHYLITHFGTIVYLDLKTMMLHHGRIGHVPENLMATGSDTAVLLTCDVDGRREVVGDLGPGGCRCLPDDPAPCHMQLRRHAADSYTLHWSGRVLTAEAEGYVSLFRSLVGHWEVFLLVTEEELAELKFVMLNSWMQRRPERVFAPSDIGVQEGSGVRFGEHVIPWTEVMQLIRKPADQRPSVALEIVTLFDDWKLLVLRLYRPLVYFVAFGSAEIFACAELAIQSLRNVGNAQVDILVITDRAHTRAVTGYGENVTAVALQSYDVLDFALARYKIADLPLAIAYQPIVYLDTDVVCNGPLDTLFRTLCFSDDLHALPEGTLMTEADFYGRTLFQLDVGVGSETDSGLSTGILGFRNVAFIETTFRLILASAYSYARHTGNRGYFPAFDQPFANYVLLKGCLGLKSLESWAVGSSHVVEPSYGPESRLGLIHFAGGVGNAAPKIERMRQYLSNIGLE